MLINRSGQTNFKKTRKPFSSVKFTMAVLSTLLLQSNLAVAAERSLQNEPQHQARIQLAILLDTSGSMDGLIDQTRNQLWQVVNEFSSTKKNGVTPILEVALFEYGNDGNPENDGYVRKLNSFTRELDKVSEGLFSLTTNGGEEYCGAAIQTAIHDLQWSQSNDNIKTIFIAGNEPFTQGPVYYQHALKLARQQGIAVNTIHAGDHQQGIQTGWQSAALLAGGNYMSIDANQKVVHIEAPQDQEIAELNARLNQTYVPFGAAGKESIHRQEQQDRLSSKISAGLLAKRAKSKATSFYNNAEWDLVDAFEQGTVQQEQLSKMDDAQLPASMAGMSIAEKEGYVKAKADQRKDIKRQISRLSAERKSFVQEHKKNQAVAFPSMSDALVEAIKRQAEKKQFSFYTEIE